MKQEKLLWYLSCLFFFFLTTCPSLVSPNCDIPLSPELFLSVPQTGQPNVSSPSLGVLVPCESRCFKLTFNTNDHRGRLREAATQARVKVQPELTVEGGNWTNLSLNLFLFISLIFTDFWNPIAGTSRQQELRTAGYITSIVWNRQTCMYACLLNSFCSALYTRYMWYRIKFWWMLQFECDICSLTPLDPIILNVLSM